MSAEPVNKKKRCGYYKAIELLLLDIIADRPPTPEIKCECPFTAVEGEDYCIFHLPAEKKKPEDFWRHLASYIKALLDKSGTEETDKWAKKHPEHPIFMEAEDELVNYYASFVKEKMPWDFTGFIFSPVDDYQHNFIDFVFPAVNFSEARFHGEASFWRAEFHGEASFSGARFHGEASFSEARFHGAASFSGARFHGEASFSGARFQGAASFRIAEFHGAASFRFSRFNSPVYFNRAVVNNVLDFTAATLRNRLLFAGTKFNGNARVLLWSLDFVYGTSDIKMEDGHKKGEIIEPAGQVVFQDIYQGMNRVSFLHTDILTDRVCVRFSNVKWQTAPKEFIFDAKFVFNKPEQWASATGLDAELINLIPELFFAEEKETDKEKQEREQKQLEECEPLVKQDVERIAREIRLYYEKYGNYPDAGDYYVAEMDYRREQASGFIKFALDIYRFISNYGESPALALKRLGELWLIFANLYFWLGFEEKFPLLWKEWLDKSPLEILERGGMALIAGVVNMIPGYFRFQKGGLECWYVSLLMVVHALFGIGVLTLFLLAVRRRFRR